jgi:nitric oxide synthase-interacting protein
VRLGRRRAPPKDARRGPKDARARQQPTPPRHPNNNNNNTTVQLQDSIGAFHECCLTLQPAVDPVVTPDGYIYSREAIVASLLQQKKAAKRARGEWEALRAREEQRAADGAAAAADAEVASFDRRTNAGASAGAAAGAARAIRDEAARAAAPGAAASSFATRLDEQRAQTMTAFWGAGVTPAAAGGGGAAGGSAAAAAAAAGGSGAGGGPSAAAAAAAALPPKPSDETVCPASGKRLRLKDLQPVRFTRADELVEGGQEEEGRGRAAAAAAEAGGPPPPAAVPAARPLYVDPVTRRELTNAARLVVLVPGGQVMSRQSYEAAVVADGGRYDGARVERAIELRTGGTGFSARSGAKLESQKFYAVGQGSGLADVRGQNPSAASRFAGRIV